MRGRGLTKETFGSFIKVEGSLCPFTLRGLAQVTFNSKCDGTVNDSLTFIRPSSLSACGWCQKTLSNFHSTQLNFHFLFASDP